VTPALIHAACGTTTIIRDGVLVCPRCEVENPFTYELATCSCGDDFDPACALHGTLEVER